MQLWEVPICAQEQYKSAEAFCQVDRLYFSQKPWEVKLIRRNH
jgi:hypothetical protein